MNNSQRSHFTDEKDKDENNKSALHLTANVEVPNGTQTVLILYTTCCLQIAVNQMFTHKYLALLQFIRKSSWTKKCYFSSALN